MTEHHDVVVVGAGLLGLAAARALARRDVDVVVLEQDSVGHQGSGSKGSCRIFRLGYEDAGYVALARQARELWNELEHAAGEPLLHPVPQLTSGSKMPVVMAALRQAGAACELLSAAEAAERFPGVAVGGPALLEPESAVIAADRVLATLAAAVPDLRTGVRVTSLADDGRRARLGTSPGTTSPGTASADGGGASADGGGADIEADTVIVCAGPWSGGLLGTAGIALRSAATLEQVAYLTGIPHGGLPIFIHFGAEVPYGLPVPGSPRYKFGLHHTGQAADPARQDQAADGELSRRIERAARRFLPSLDPRPAAVERCVYDNSPDTDFIVDRIGNVVIGSGTSGHGFKFGPLLGEWLAVLAVPPEPGSGQGWLTGVPPRFAAGRLANRPIQSGYGR